MRAFEGQRSDNQPVKRSPEEKQKLLRELRETLAGMKPHAAPRSAAERPETHRRVGGGAWRAGAALTLPCSRAAIFRRDVLLPPAASGGALRARSASTASTRPGSSGSPAMSKSMSIGGGVPCRHIQPGASAGRSA